MPEKYLSDLYKTVLDRTHFLFAYMDCDFNFIWVNRAYAEADEKDPDFFPGKNHFDLYPNRENETIFKNVVRTGHAYRALAKPFEYVSHPQRGKSYWNWELTPLSEREGVVANLLLGLDNVTEAMLTQEKLFLLSAAVEQSSEGIAIADMKGDLLFVNNAFAAMHGFEQREVRGKHLSIFHTPGQMIEVRKSIKEVLGKGVFRGELLHAKNDGSSFVGFMHNTLMRNDSGEPLALLGTLQDMTAYYDSRTALEQSELKYKELFNHMGNGVVVYEARNGGQDFVIIEFNAAAEKIEKSSRGLVVGKSILEVFPGVKEFGLFAVMQQVWKTGQAAHHPVSFYRDERISGWRENYVYKLPQGEIVTVYQDITALKQEEEKLRRSEERFRSIINKMTDAIFISDMNANLIDVNRQACTSLGYSRNELLQLTMADVDPMFSFDNHLDNIWDKLSSNATVIFESRHQRKDGSDFPVEIHIGKIELNEEPVIIGVARDITERNKSEEEIKQLAKFPSENPNPVLRADKDGILLYVNRSSDLLLKKWDCQAGEQLPEDFCQLISRTLEANTTETFELICDEQVFAMSISPVPANAFVNIYGLNITKRKQTEEALQKAHDELDQRVKDRTLELQKIHIQLLHAEKLASTGRLAASIAHEFGSPIYGLRNLLSSLRKEIVQHNLDEKIIELAQSECSRIEKFLEKLRQFNRPSPGIKSLVDFHALIDDMLLLCKENLDEKHISVRKNLCANLPAIRAVPDQIKQVLLNLLNNAIDSIQQEKGEIEIRTETAGKWALIHIQDSGEGIDPADLELIFEPFFTTKGEAKGLGLGLSVCYSIIQNHGGKIEVKSKPGRGSTFTIMLPQEIPAGTNPMQPDSVEPWPKQTSRKTI